MAAAAGEHRYPASEQPLVLFLVVVLAPAVFCLPVFFVVLENDALEQGFRVSVLILYGLLLFAIFAQAMVYFSARTFCTDLQYYSNLVHYAVTCASLGGSVAWFSAAVSAEAAGPVWVASLVLGSMNSLYVTVCLFSYMSSYLCPGCWSRCRCRCSSAAVVPFTFSGKPAFRIHPSPSGAAEKQL